jgi:hypothetical protein
MRRLIGIPVAILLSAAAGCDSSSPTKATVSSTAPEASALWSMVKINTHGTGAGLQSTAVIDGFRVHPDPDEDGVIHVFADESVVVNASDIASRPPAPQSFLVVNWGDGPNQRVGCGPCRADHVYAPGRFRLVASADNLQPSAGSGTDRSISLQVQVSSRREKPGPFVSRFQSFGFDQNGVQVGATFYFVLPIPLPPGIMLAFPGITLNCTPFDAAFPDILAPFQPFPGGIGLPFTAIKPGTCVATISGTDANGPFTETSTLTIQ